MGSVSTKVAGTTYVALLRGINVGGKNKLPMRDLLELFEASGCGALQSYIQSGNVVFRAPAAVARQLPQLLPQAIADRFGYRVPLILRTAAQMRQAVERNPFLGSGADTKPLAVGFLAGKPQDSLVRALDPNRSPPDEFRVVGHEIYLRCPNGIARSKLTNVWFDRQLATISTFRNWNTTLKLVELSS